MATLKGQNAFSNVNLLGIVGKEVINKEGKSIGHMVDFQVDQSHLLGDEAKMASADTNPHLVSRVFTTDKDEKRITHWEFYSHGQLEQFDAVAKSCELEDGKRGIALQGNLRTSSYKDEAGDMKKKVIVLTTSEKEGKEKSNNFVSLKSHPGLEELTPETFAAQAEVKAKAKEARKAAYEASKEAQKEQTMEAENEGASQEMDQDLPF